MPYSYHESTTLSHENALALKSLAATGELPKDHYWNALRDKHDANSTRFDRGNAVLGALLDRDQAQRQGTATASTPLFPNSGFITYALGKHDLNSVRFDHWHPFLGHLFEIKLPAGPGSTAGETLTGGNPGTPGNPTPPGGLLPPPDSGTGSGGGSGPVQPNGVPEPASAVLMGLAMTCALAGVLIRRRFQARPAAPPALA